MKVWLITLGNVYGGEDIVEVRKEKPDHKTLGELGNKHHKGHWVDDGMSGWDCGDNYIQSYEWEVT